MNTKKEIIIDAVNRHYSIPAINFDSFDVLKALIKGAGECGAPLFVQTTEPAIETLGAKRIVFMKNELENEYGANIILHLDHGENIDIIKKCVDAGYDSVMIDASDKSLEENAKITRDVIEYAHEKGVIVESEIGHVGGAGDDNIKTEIDVIKSYIDIVKPDMLAVSVGSSHGGREKTRTIDFELLKNISDEIKNYPLVLHGSSGVVEKDLAKVSEYGICKINIETELRLLYRKATMDYYESDINHIKIRELHNFVCGKIKEFVEYKSMLFNSYGMA